MKRAERVKCKMSPASARLVSTAHDHQGVTRIAIFRDQISSLVNSETDCIMKVYSLVDFVVSYTLLSQFLALSAVPIPAI